MAIRVKVKISPQLLTLGSRLETVVQRAHETSARQQLEELRQQIIEVDALASFSLLRSIEKQFEQKDLIQKWLIGSQLNYAPFVEYGRRPGKQPPVDAILKWLAFRNIQPVNRSTAFLIARAIGRRGIKGRFPFKRALDVFFPQIEPIFEKELLGAINQ